MKSIYDLHQENMRAGVAPQESLRRAIAAVEAARGGRVIPSPEERAEAAKRGVPGAKKRLAKG